VPLSFLTRKWRRRVRSGDDLDARAWEVALLVHLRDRLRAGDIWVEGSRAWRSFEDYLLNRATFVAMRDEGRLGLAVPDSRGVAERTDRDAGRPFEGSCRSGCKRHDPRRHADRQGAVDQSDRRGGSRSDRRTQPALYALVPRVRITGLLAEVHRWTGFLDRFTHYRTGDTAGDELR
jgi:hypothetical protein